MWCFHKQKVLYIQYLNIYNIYIICIKIIFTVHTVHVFIIDILVYIVPSMDHTSKGFHTSSLKHWVVYHDVVP